MDSTLRARYEVIEALPWSAGGFAEAAYKAREVGAGSGAAAASYDAPQRVVLLRRLPAAAAASPVVRAASARYAALPRDPAILAHYGLADIDGDDGAIAGAALPDGCYAVSEWARGISLQERVRRVAPFSTAVALDIAAATTQALIAAQADGLPHGDLTAEEVILPSDGPIKVADFALGHAVRAALGQAEVAGSDMRAVAALLYQMLTGAVADAAGAAPLSPAAAQPGIAAAVDGITRKASLPASGGGYRTADALLADLQTAREDLRAGRALDWSPLPRPAATAASVPNPAPAPASAPAAPAQQESIVMPGTDPSNPSRVDVGGRTQTARPAPPAQHGHTSGGYDAEGGDAGGDDYDDGYRPPSAGAIWLRRFAMFMAAVLVIAAVFAVAYFALLVSNVPSDITVPNLIGKQYTDAGAIAGQQHFHLVEMGHDNSDTWPEGAIYRQEPTEGRSIKSGKDVDVFVSDGPRLLAVPDLSQSTLDKARSLLTDSGLPAGSVTYSYNPVVPRGIVTTQQPAAGAKVSRNAAVNLVVSKGPPPPPPPTGLSATTTIPGEIDLAWNGAPVAATYDVYRDGKKIASQLPETTYSDVGLTDSATHVYTVTAVNSNGESAQSASASANPQPGPPAAPGDTSGDAGTGADADAGAGAAGNGGGGGNGALPSAPPSVADNGGAPKQRQFDVRFHVPRASAGRHNVQIQVQDTTGTNTVYDEDRYGGDVVDEQFTAFGNRVIFRVFIDSRLAKQETK